MKGVAANSQEEHEESEEEDSDYMEESHRGNYFKETRRFLGPTSSNQIIADALIESVPRLPLVPSSTNKNEKTNISFEPNKKYSLGVPPKPPNFPSRQVVSSGFGQSNTSSGWGNSNTSSGFGQSNTPSGWGNPNTSSGCGNPNKISGWGNSNKISGWGASNIRTERKTPEIIYSMNNLMEDEHISMVIVIQRTLYELEESNFEESCSKLFEFGLTEDVCFSIVRYIIRYSYTEYRKVDLYVKLLSKIHKSYDITTLFNDFTDYCEDMIAFDLVLKLVEEKIFDTSKCAKILDEFIIYNDMETIIREDDIEGLKNAVLVPSFDINQFFKRVFSTELSRPNLIEYAAFCASEKCFRYLFINGADYSKAIEYAIAGGSIVIIQLLEESKIIPKPSHIITAIEFHRYDIVDWLIDKFENIDAENIFNNCISFEFPYKLDIVKQIHVIDLLEFSYDKFFVEIVPALLKFNDMESQRKNAIMKAYKATNIDLMRYLIIRGYKLKDENPLKDMISSGADLDLFRLILGLPGINVNYQNPLYEACKVCNRKAFEMLLNHRDIDINYRNDGENAVIYAAIGVPVFLKLLLQRPELDINAKNYTNGTHYGSQFPRMHVLLNALKNIESFSLIVESDKFKDIPDSIVVLFYFKMKL